MMTRLPVTFAVGLGAAAAAVVGAAGAAVGLAAGAAVAAAAVVGAAGLGASVGLGAAGAVVAAGAGAWPHAATIVITTPDVKPNPRRPRRVKRRVVGVGNFSSAPITPPQPLWIPQSIVACDRCGVNDCRAHYVKRSSRSSSILSESRSMPSPGVSGTVTMP